MRYLALEKMVKSLYGGLERRLFPGREFATPGVAAAHDNPRTLALPLPVRLQSATGALGCLPWKAGIG